MAFRKENKSKTSFSKISIGLASPEEILEKSQKQIDYIKTENLSKLEQEMRNKEKDAEERIKSSARFSAVSTAAVFAGIRRSI